jgi:hypothetical protein
MATPKYGNIALPLDTIKPAYYRLTVSIFAIHNFDLIHSPGITPFSKLHTFFCSWQESKKTALI